MKNLNSLFSNLEEIIFNNKTLISKGFYFIGIGNCESNKLIMLEELKYKENNEFPKDLDSAKSFVLKSLEDSGMLSELKNAFGDNVLDNYYITFANKAVGEVATTQILYACKVFNNTIFQFFDKKIFIGKMSWFSYADSEKTLELIANGRVIYGNLFVENIGSLQMYLGDYLNDVSQN